ncbi:MAG: DNA gyrase subunit A [Chloroflexi bacterium GWB2_49_20]|nr:MAG: DNA gyrase subunit A [Chloroflexi bacterium GWB2_49_20]OGN78442.1 MAG: DNA gyrase subunit A [Chloroflexi bacterium GWC2_49_37]OGN84095.1 MAG: DNA gyrase subunit A [Chloroflexi bacterium GWD2_49_16]HBG75258.1 DNA gyrase subunit A [Anaerolineae bacterium]HCC79107.1 DNA gyrase subunit A [Anaerolineae bacterium]
MESENNLPSASEFVGSVQMVDIDEQMRTAYIDYAMSVIVARALPDARDGLKPVHRRILFAMQELGMRSNSAYKKSARIVGEVLGKYHPHGDAAVYESMARMAQDFSMRYMLVDGQGNFGSVDGDSPAAMRYTEARLAKMAEEMLADIEKNTVKFTDNFDGSLQEPQVLPSRLPNLLLNGSSGIAVGMATNIPPHNLKELSAAIIYLINNYDTIDDIPVEDLMKFITGPDFPTGGIIVGKEGIEQAYGTGRGRIVIRGLAHIEEMKAGRFRIVITEIPYQVNKTTLIERFADLARSGKIDAISDLRDESDRRGMNIVIELKKNAQPKKVLNQLFKYTALQSTFGVSMLALVDNEPRTLPLKKALHLFIQHRQDVITRRIKFDLDKARHRAHILEGLLIALTNLDDVIDTIRKSPDADVAKERLITRFNLSEIQAQAILDMQLRRLAALERQKIEDEYKQTQAQIAYFEDLLADPKKILAIIQEDMNELTEKYGDERRTRIAVEASEGFNEEDLVPDESVLVSMTARGYIKRVAVASYRSQGVGGKGVTGHSTKLEDEVINLIPAHTLDTMLFFSDRGKVYSEKVYQIPDADRTNKGIPLVNILSLDPGEVITAAVSVPKFDEGKFITLATTKGRVKRMSLSALSAVRPSGIISINLAEGDELGWARLTNGKDDVILVTEHGQALRFSEEILRAMGRTGAGVTGIRLADQDRLASMEVVEPDGALLLITTKGYGKRTLLTEYPSKRRGARGIATTNKKALGSIGLIASARVVQESDDLTIISANGQVLRAKVKNLRLAGRATRGVKLMGVKEGDRIVSLARTSSAELIKVGALNDGNDNDNGTEPGQQFELPEMDL